MGAGLAADRFATEKYSSPVTGKPRGRKPGDAYTCECAAPGRVEIRTECNSGHCWRCVTGTGPAAARFGRGTISLARGTCRVASTSVGVVKGSFRRCRDSRCDSGDSDCRCMRSACGGDPEDGLLGGLPPRTWSGSGCPDTDIQRVECSNVSGNGNPAASARLIFQREEIQMPRAMVPHQ